MIEHSRDFRRVKKLWKNRLFPWLSAPIDIGNDSYYLIEVQAGRDVGVWYLHPYTDGLMIHVMMIE